VTPAELTGRARSHIVDAQDPPCALHLHALTSFLQLRRAAAGEGLDLRPQSAFRNFERQLSIWNRKWSGALPLYGARGEALDALSLPPAERLEAILRWSALPGASRHHWGTDLDLVDGHAIAAGYRVQLVPEEYTPPGPFARLATWLDANAARFGFFRPFRGVRSGVHPEPWHYSFAPVAEPARRRLTPAVLRDALLRVDLSGREEALPRLEELHGRYVASIDWP
jgi:LAS superfamily LD-carboxypeptidase LdcB